MGKPIAPPLYFVGFFISVFMDEIWKDVPNYKGWYKVSNLGRIMCVLKGHNGRIAQNHYRGNGTVYVRLNKNKICRAIDLAETVASVFVPNTEKCLFVNFKDGNVKNCTALNLFWSETPWNIENNSIEEWRNVRGYEGIYVVSNLANIKRIDNIDKPVNPHKYGSGRVVVGLSNKKRSIIGLANIVATAFLPNPQNYKYVAFKDRDVSNCHADNLYWARTGNSIPTQDGEVWKDVVGYEGKYVVSNFGRVYSLTRVRSNAGASYKGRMLKLQETRGYLYTTLLNGYGIHKRMPVHRIVAMAFLPNPYNKPTIDHIDGSPSNNHVSNLRWATMKENVNNPNTLWHKTALMEGRKNPMAQPIYGINLTTGERIDFDCMDSATKFLGVKYQKYIGMCCKATWKTYKGYSWHYA